MTARGEVGSSARALRAVLVVDHGSRVPEAGRATERLLAALQSRLPGVRVALAHLEAVPPGVEEAILSLYREGVRDLRVHPFFLGRGRHVERDLPRAVARAAERCPGLRVRISEPVAGHPLLVEIVLERLSDAGGG